MLRSELTNDKQSLVIKDPSSINSKVEVIRTNEYELQMVFDQVQESIQLISAPLLKIAVVITDHRQYLLFVAHHLIIDGVSWRILLEDFFSLYLREHDSTNHLPYKSTSYKEWSSKIKTYANNMTDDDVNYWREITIDPHDRINYYEDEGLIKRNKRKSLIKEYEFYIPSKTIEDLFSTAYEIDGLEINTVLLTALYIATKQSRSKNALNLMLESHGRVPLTENQDLSRTVGWFTSIYPIRFDIDCADLKRNIHNIQKILNAVPMMGIGYGALLYSGQISADFKEHLMCLQSKISFNYLGNIDILGSNRGTNSHDYKKEEKEIPLRLSKSKPGDCISPQNNLTHDLQIVGAMKEGSINFKAIYNDNVFDKESVTHLMQQFETSIYEIVSYYKSINLKELDKQPDNNYSAVGLHSDDLTNIQELIDN
jgi:non-ribosomal peptide synthase protein (TIGR01720 family)